MVLLSCPWKEGNSNVCSLAKSSLMILRLGFQMIQRLSQQPNYTTLCSPRSHKFLLLLCIFPAVDSGWTKGVWHSNTIEILWWLVVNSLRLL